MVQGGKGTRMTNGKQVSRGKGGKGAQITRFWCLDYANESRTRVRRDVVQVVQGHANFTSLCG